MNTNNNYKIVNSETGETFYSTEAAIYESKIAGGSSELNRILKSAKTSDGFVTWQERFDAIRSVAIKNNGIITEQAKNDFVTEKQLSYLSILGVKNVNSNMTKSQASNMINLVKSEGLSVIGQADDGGKYYTTTCEIY